MTVRWGWRGYYKRTEDGVVFGLSRELAVALLTPAFDFSSFQYAPRKVTKPAKPFDGDEAFNKRFEQGLAMMRAGEDRSRRRAVLFGRVQCRIRPGPPHCVCWTEERARCCLCGCAGSGIFSKLSTAAECVFLRFPEPLIVAVKEEPYE